MPEFLGINPALNKKLQAQEKAEFDFESLFDAGAKEAPKGYEQPEIGQPPPLDAPVAQAQEEAAAIPEYEVEDRFMDLSPEKESTLGWGIRNIAGVTRDLIATGVGLPFSMLRAGAEGFAALTKKLPRPKGISEEDWSKPVVDPEQLGGLPTIGGIKLDPTISGVKNIIGDVAEKFGLPANYFEGATQGEKKSREILEHAFTLMHPLLGGVSLPKALIGVASYNTGKLGAEAVGLGKVGQEIVGHVTQALSFGWDPKKIKKTMDNLYNVKATNALRDAKVWAVNSKPLVKQSFHPEKYFRNPSDLTIAEEWIKKRSGGIANAIKSEKIDVEKLWNLKKSFNKHVGEFKGPFKDISKFVKETGDVFNDMITDYGKKYSPEFLKAYKEANSMYKGFNRIPKIVGALGDQFEKRSGLAMLGVASGHIAPIALGKIFLLKKGIEAGYALKTSPAILKYFAKGVAEATKGNMKSSVKYFAKADKVLEKKYPGVKEELLKKADKKPKGSIEFLGIKSR